MKGDPSILNNLILYEIYIRNHGSTGTFNDVIRDLKRIKSLGVDVIWLMPIHPIGEKHKKGTLGCPYSIRDYRKINPEYGTIQDFQNLIEKAHQLGLKVMIDVVYNHTSHDSTLVIDHPEYFHQDQDGNPVTSVPAWSDVIDLKHPNPQLQKYLIETLCYWVKMGVDGFRCDVASIVPLSFWLDAKKQVEAINPDVIWLAESVHTAWVIDRRLNGLFALSDSELYEVFDLTYDYDIWPIWQAALKGKVPVLRYLEMLEFQKGIYPTGFIKMRCVENHDNPRIMALASDEVSAKAWTAFEIFNKGAFLLYAGQESGASHTPSLFEIDKIDWLDYRLQDWYKQLCKIKKSDVFVQGTQHFLAASPAIQTLWQHHEIKLFGIFNVSNFPNQIHCQLPDGDYRDLISNKTLNIVNQKIKMKGDSAYIFEINNSFTPKILDFELLEYSIQ
jgi:glycosidase